MTDQEASEVWSRILAVLDEQLQYGFLEQARSIVNVRLNGGELTLEVSNADAADFFAAEVNQQRLMIVSRPVISLEAIRVVVIDAEPLK